MSTLHSTPEPGPEAADPAPMQTVCLTPEQWSELRDHLQVAEQFIPGAERREHERHDAQTHSVILFEYDGADARYEAMLRNISISGIAFLHHQEITPNTPAAVTLSDLAGNHVRLPGIVVRSELIEDGIFDTGFAFLQPIDPESHTDARGHAITAMM